MKTRNIKCIALAAVLSLSMLVGQVFAQDRVEYRFEWSLVADALQQYSGSVAFEKKKEAENWSQLAGDRVRVGSSKKPEFDVYRRVAPGWGVILPANYNWDMGPDNQEPLAEQLYYWGVFSSLGGFFAFDTKDQANGFVEDLVAKSGRVWRKEGLSVVRQSEVFWAISSSSK